MKQIYFLISFLFVQIGVAQQQDPRADRFNYEPNTLIVKLKDAVSAGVTYDKTGKGQVSNDIKEILGLTNKIKNTQVLFSKKSVETSVKRKQAQTKRIASRSKEEESRNGFQEEEIISLKNIFVLEFENKQENIESLIEELSKNPDVEFAEPNYRYSINDFTIESEILTEEDVRRIKAEENSSLFAAPNDALYSQQSNISAVKLDQVWDSGITGDNTQVIAILDTGVDYTHPDLEANSWINQAELNGVAGYDDDGNGYVDDIHGWDFINQDGEPLDDNMHGTHVAGIAGAVGNNEVGIAGAAWDVKLMPVKVFQSNGVGNATTIAEGIDYAAQNGASVINMSFGSYAESMTMKAALDNAYATAVLVASAGNSGLCIGPGKCPDGKLSAPSYPGAYTYVLGVQDAAQYSNYDQDGPIYSGYPNLLNYEIKAPGTKILSTVPAGGYRELTGTSMSAPLIAGGIALYLKAKPEDSKELLFGNLINTASGFVDFKAALDVVPTPELKALSAMTKDTLTGQNGNGYLEPGEVIDILPLVKNYWGPTEDVRVGIEFAEFEDTSKAQIIKNEIAIGSITAYAELQDLTQSLQIKLAEGLANNVNIKFNLKVWSGPEKEYLSSTEFVINVKNSILLYGIISQDMTLTPDKEYLVSDNLILNKDAILTILPGVTLKISNGKKMNAMDNARILALGKKDSLIKFVNEDLYWSGFGLGSSLTSTFDFCEFTGFSVDFGFFDSKSNNYSVSNSIIAEGYANFLFWSTNGKNILYTTSNFLNNQVGNLGGPGAQSITKSNIIGTSSKYSYSDQLYGFYFGHYDLGEGFFESNIFDNKSSLEALFSGTSTPLLAYLGTSKKEKLRNEIFDALNSSDHSGLFDLDSILYSPSATSHSIVWKVLVNGKDAQDEYDLMDPVGVGPHKFQVYFNRPMDTSIDPQISYGVREPYNQKIISEPGTWSADGKIYTVNHEVKIGAADGINRIRVQNARDLDYFEIPVEDFRFNMLVQSAGSASSGFFATPELGKIDLSWEEPTPDLLEDVLGYNLYRHKAITDSTFTEPVKLNESLIADPDYSDFEVEEGNKYFYQYKILRTNFEESDYSKTVAASPLTSTLGDSNGDFDVNVLDLVQDVDYILGMNPQPFIFKAADVNNDETINVLDIVGTVDIINSPATAAYSVSASNTQPAYYSNEAVGEVNFYWEGQDLYAESEYPIGAFQLSFEEGFTYEINEELSSFEWTNYKQDDSRIVMMYSFTGKSLDAGKTKILTRKNEETQLQIDKAVVGTPKGERLTATFSEKELIDIGAPLQPDTMNLNFWPNPTRGEFNMQYYLPEQMDQVRASLYNFQGQRVWFDDNSRNTPGNSEQNYDFGQLSRGIYILVIDAVRGGEIKHRKVKKIVIE